MVCTNLQEKGKGDLFFSTSKEEIQKLIHDDRDIVSVAKIDDTIAAACYITFSHSIYDDLTLYIKNSKLYKEMIFSSYSITTLLIEYVKYVNAYSQFKKFGIFNKKLLDSTYKKVQNNDFFECD